MKYKNFNEKWLDFMIVPIETKKVDADLSEYFFNQFVYYPEGFFGFLDFLKRNLLTNKFEAKTKKKIARRYLNIISYLCERFSFFNQKNELDNICFKISQPQKYRRISKAIAEYRNEADKYIRHISQKIKTILNLNGYNFELNGRYKNNYSIYKKMKKKRIKKIKRLDDIFAFRIILESNEEQECFEVLNILHDNFEPIVDRYKNYITIPKINGYQSIHTSLRGLVSKLRLPVEVQIRTRKMHEIAENGLAAHWIYSKDKKAKLINDKEKKLLQYFSGIDQEDYVYFFSYHKKVVKVKKGSTIVDFAYMIHSDLGNKIKGAVVNGKEKPIDYILQEGDFVKILKGFRKSVKPSWLKLANNRITRKIIKHETS